MPLWWKKEKIHHPWQDDFNIDYVVLDNPGSRNFAYWSVPEDHFIEIIHVRYYYVLSGGAATHMFFLKVFRGNNVIFCASSTYPGLIASRRFVNWNRNAQYATGNWDDLESTWPLPTDWFLYPHDVLQIGASLQGAANMTFSGITITFKDWKTG